MTNKTTIEARGFKFSSQSPIFTLVIGLIVGGVLGIGANYWKVSDYYNLVKKLATAEARLEIAQERKEGATRILVKHPVANSERLLLIEEMDKKEDSIMKNY